MKRVVGWNKVPYDRRYHGFEFNVPVTPPTLLGPSCVLLTDISKCIFRKCCPLKSCRGKMSYFQLYVEPILWTPTV